MKIGSMIAGLLLAAVAAIMPTQAWAWGEEGHLTICEIAYRNLTPTANDAVDTLLNSKSGGIKFPAKKGKADYTAARYYTVFNLACLEEDTRPRKNSSQHFINVARDTTAIVGGTCPPKDKDDERLTNCILNGIKDQSAILGNSAKSQRERVEALMGLGHWIGDLHQPLHISYSDDNGGNDIFVRLIEGAKCGTSGYRPKNLHAVWDGCILQSSLFEIVRQSKPYKDAEARGKPWKPKSVIFAAATDLVKGTTLTDEIAWSKTEPWQWAQESYVKTREKNSGYCFKSGADCRYSETLLTLPPKPKNVKKNPLARTFEIDQKYLDDNAEFATLRIRQAGHRLAHIINLALDPGYKVPRANN